MVRLPVTREISSSVFCTLVIDGQFCFLLTKWAVGMPFLSKRIRFHLARPLVMLMPHGASWCRRHYGSFVSKRVWLQIAFTTYKKKRTIGSSKADGLFIYNLWNKSMSNKRFFALRSSLHTTHLARLSSTHLREMPIAQAGCKCGTKCK